MDIKTENVVVSVKTIVIDNKAMTLDFLNQIPEGDLPENYECIGICVIGFVENQIEGKQIVFLKEGFLFRYKYQKRQTTLSIIAKNWHALRLKQIDVCEDFEENSKDSLYEKLGMYKNDETMKAKQLAFQKQIIDSYKSKYESAYLNVIQHHARFDKLFKEENRIYII